MATEHERRAVMTLFDFALTLIPDEAYEPSKSLDSLGYEYAVVETRGHHIRHIRPIGGGYPELAFILTAAGAFAVVKDTQDAEWLPASPAQPTSRDVNPHGAGASAPARLKRTLQ
jgi:hypothetical protein